MGVQARCYAWKREADEVLLQNYLKNAKERMPLVISKSHFCLDYLVLCILGSFYVLASPLHVTNLQLFIIIKCWVEFKFKEIPYSSIFFLKTFTLDCISCNWSGEPTCLTGFKDIDYYQNWYRGNLVEGGICLPTVVYYKKQF